MEKIALLLILVVASVTSDCRNGDGKEGYAFYYPLGMGAGELTTVCLAIDSKFLPATVIVTFENVSSQDNVPHAADSEYSCWQIRAPDYRDNYYDSFKIIVNILNKHKNINFHGEDEVKISKFDEQVFIETDRGVYKKGDTVKIRYLVLGYDLKPKRNYILKNVIIQSPYPASATVAQWDSITINSGLAQIEFQLAPDTLEGYWTISSDRFYKSFEVRTYVLPRFQAILTAPDNVYINSENISIKICGKYSYGGNVKGNTLLAVVVSHGYPDNATSISKTEPLKDGCANITLSSTELELNRNYSWSIALTGTIAEEGTEQVESTTKYVYIDRNAFSYNWDYNSIYVKAGLPYKGRLSITQSYVPLKSPIFELCYKILENNSSICSNFTLDSSNNIYFTIPPLKNISTYKNIIVEARSITYPLDYNPSIYLEIWNSTSENSLKVDSNDDKSRDCGSTLKFHATYNSDGLKIGKEIEFKYILTSRSEILSIGTILDKLKKQLLDLNEYPNVIGEENNNNLKIPVGTFDFEIDLGKKVYTQSNIVVYYVKDNEVISDYIRIDINNCLPNKVDAEWSEKQLYPGETASLSVKTASEALCAVSSIDTATGFLKDNYNVLLNVDSLINGFYRDTYINKPNCIKPQEPESGTAIYPSYYYRYYSSSGYDSYQAFRDSSVGIISNLKYLIKVCQRGRYFFNEVARPVAAEGPGAESTATAGGSADSAKGASDDRGSAIRSFFPETWLWDLFTVNEKGEAVLDRKLPDSITDWVGNVLCVSSKKGVGISDDIEIKGFKPFFLDILLPYSIKRNKEILHLLIPIFNYLNDSLPIRITLEPTEGLVLVDGEAKRNFTMCLNAGDSYTHTYRIKSTKLGRINITVSGDVDPDHAKNCAPRSIIRRRDAVQKSILVEPEGYPSGLLESVLLCANESSGEKSVAWTIKLPADVVADTVDGKVIVNSDILGPLFQNLDNLLVTPTGCGEQTMATLTPNLYVLEYYISINALTEKTKEKILINLGIGYQRMLTYVHGDGSFSAFGNSDGNGSMFLTAFVIRTFRDMKQYTLIDDKVVDKAINWITTYQLENGCFDPVLHVFHEMGIASSPNQTTALTAYVIISFLETNAKVNETVLSMATECILKDDTLDKYTLAISSYALGLLNISQEAKKRLDKLIELSEHKDDLTWWQQTDNSLSASVEITSYVLISLLKQNPVKNLGIASSIVRWLQTQMNIRGAFYSTTDTVVGLDAISRYATLVNRKEPNVKVSVKTSDVTKNFIIIKRNSTNPDIVPLTTYPNSVEASIQGDGCVSVQASVNYYLDKSVTTNDLRLDIKLKAVNDKLKCTFVELKPCVSYNSPGQINMAIVEVGLPSGYAADQASLYELIANKVVNKFELIRNQVVFYLTRLGSTTVCIPFKIQESLVVENIANATVNFYDYYKPEVSISKSFQLNDCEKNTTAT